MRLVWIFVVLALVISVPFLIFGDMGLNEEKSISFLEGFGNWAWLVAIILFAGDLILPLPATAIIAALGYIYGPFLGAIIGAVGNYISANISYWLCRSMGTDLAEKLVGKKDLGRGQKLFDAWGGWMVTLSRWLPLFPEVLSCLAGMTRMPWAKFSLATLCGVIPLSFLFAWIGHMGQAHQWVAIVLSAGLPPLFWFILHRFINKKISSIENQSEEDN